MRRGYRNAALQRCHPLRVAAMSTTQEPPLTHGDAGALVAAANKAATDPAFSDVPPSDGAGSVAGEFVPPAPSEAPGAMASARPAAQQLNGGGVAAVAAERPPAEPMQLAAPAPEALTREQRFEAALSCREEGKGVKPRQGCASVQLNRECKEGTRTPEYVKFLETVRQTADAEVLGQFGTNSGSFDRADFMKVERPLQCARIVFTTVCSVSLARLTISFSLFLAVAGQVTEKYFNGELWQRMIPKIPGKGSFELRWLTRHVIAQHATAAKRQMRCNQIPRKMLQQMDHQRRHIQSAPASVQQAGPEPGQRASTGHDVTGHARSPSVRSVDAPNGAVGEERPKWEKDKRVIQTTVARSRIESSLAAIQAQLRTGCVHGEVVHKTVQLTYALVFGTLGPMLQSVFNLSVLYQREFQLCQQVLCTIAGALTRLFGSAWHMSLASILAPGMREFSIRLSPGKSKSFDRLEVAVCFIWAALLQSAERNYVSQVVLDSWSSIPNGMWGEGRTDLVVGLQRDEAAAAISICSRSGDGAFDDPSSSHSDDSGSGESDAVSYVHPPGQYSEEEREAVARRSDISQNGMSAQNMRMGMSASEGRQTWSNGGGHLGPGAGPGPGSDPGAGGGDGGRPVPAAVVTPSYATGDYDSSILQDFKKQRTG